MEIHHLRTRKLVHYNNIDCVLNTYSVFVGDSTALKNSGLSYYDITFGKVCNHHSGYPGQNPELYPSLKEQPQMHRSQG